MTCINLEGQKFGKLLVMHRDLNMHKNEAYWICKCDCGNIARVKGSNLRGNRSKSCGCSTNVTHGFTGTSEHNIWNGMRERCHNPNNPSYKYYGGRGIKVCDEWIESFNNFYKDIGPKPSPEHSIDRIDNDGNYEPGNCKWSTKTEQGRNRNYNKIKSKEQADEIRYKYQTGNCTRKQLSIEYKCNRSTIDKIINNKTWI